MIDRKLSDIEVQAELCAKQLAEMPNDWFTSGVMPLALMQASSTLRQLSLRIARVEKNLATERRLHRETEKRAETMKVERDVARRERDEVKQDLRYEITQGIITSCAG